MDPDQYAEFCDSCTQEFTAKNREWDQRFAIARVPRWDYDDTDRLLVFSDASGPQVLCTYLNVGTLSTKTNTWLWSWANESLAAATYKGMTKVRAFGRRNRIDELSEPHFEAGEGDAWTLSAIAGHMLKAQAIYRPVADHLQIFMLVMSTRRIEA